MLDSNFRFDFIETNLSSRFLSLDRSENCLADRITGSLLLDVPHLHRKQRPVVRAQHAITLHKICASLERELKINLPRFDAFDTFV